MMKNMMWILLALLLGTILAGCVAPRKNQLTFAARGVESEVVWETRYTIEY
jgi:outer membrane murein-binding lipoprotein Lpp